MRRKYLPSLPPEPGDWEDEAAELEWEEEQELLPARSRYRPLMRNPQGGLVPARRPVGRPARYAPPRYYDDDGYAPPGYYDDRNPLGGYDARVQGRRLRPGTRMSMRQYSGVDVTYHRSFMDQAIRVLIVLGLGVLLFKCDFNPPNPAPNHAAPEVYYAPRY